MTGIGGLVAPVPATLPEPEAATAPRATSFEVNEERPRGIGFNQFGDAMNLAELSEEDTAL